MPREPRLDMLPDKDMKLSGSHFRKVVRRIESIVPIAGTGIVVEPVEGGHKISLNEEEQSNGLYGECGFIALGYADLFQSVALNVCSNGTPDVIYVLQSKRGGSGGEDFLCEI
jgi:hypothetical protein